MEMKDERMMDAFVMDLLSRVTAFDMFAQAMVYVRAAAEAGGTVDMLSIGAISSPFEENSLITARIFENKYLTAFGDIEPWPEEKENPTPEEIKAFEEAEKNMTHNFTLNENGWKFAEYIKQLWDAMKDIAPSQSQLDQWNREEYEIRKKKIFADKEAE